MEGFFAAGKIHEMHELLREVIGANADSHYFVDRELVPAVQPLAKLGDNTYLKDALNAALAKEPRPSILWLATDNQPSTGNQTSSDQDIAQFYESLKSDGVKRLYFFPLRLPFSGKLFREDGFTTLLPKYEGPRGLLIYALLLDENARDDFERATSEFQSSFKKLGTGDLRRILIKPLEHDTITAKLIPGNKFKLDKDGHLVAGDFDEGVPIKGDFKVELTSQLGQMKISQADIDVRVPEGFRTGDFTESEIRPNFTPRNIQNFEPQNKRVIDVALNSDGVHIRNNLVSWWNCITHNRGDITGQVQIIVKATPENLDVVSQLTNEFSTDRDIYQNADPAVQSKIYRLDVLAQKMMPARPVEIRPRVGTNADGRIPVTLTVLYPKTPGVVLVAAIIFLLVLLFFLWRFFTRRQLYRLTWSEGRYRACPDFHVWPLIGQRVEIDDRPVAIIKTTIGGLRVRAARGYTVDDTSVRMLRPGGTDFNVSHSNNGTGANFYFSSVTAALRGRSHKVGADNDILGGVSYGASDGAGESRSRVPVSPPIRKPTTERNFSVTSDAKPPKNDDFDYSL